MLKTAPNPVDVQDLQFKLRCRLKVFENKDGTNFPQPCNLIACASRFGLIFVGANTAHFQVIQLKHLEEYSKNDGDKADYPRRHVSIPSSPKFLSVNCEHTMLSVVIEKNNCPVALFYDVKSFWQKDIVQLTEIRLSPTPGVNVVDVNWNPALSAIFTACKSDGTLGIYELKNLGVDINELPTAAGATCFCWSPKGKQIAIGSRDGKITQYKPDLKAVKVINAPPLKEPHVLISLQWISNYQFIGVFSPINLNNPPTLIVIDAPKTGETVYINYDDICYSNGNTRPVQFYMITQHHWNLLMVASSNSMEVGILGYANENWTQWIMGDAARAELPLSASHQETLPIGFGLDIGCMQPLQWGESMLPPCPILLVLSHYGILCCFNVVNLKEGIPTLCSPPEAIKDVSGLTSFVTKNEIKQSAPTKEQTVEQPVSQISQTPQAKPTKTILNTPTVFEIPTSSTPNKQPELIFSTTQPSSIFGGQATLIPISQGIKNVTSASPLLPSPITYQTTYPSSINENKAPTTAAPVQKTSSPFFTKEVTVTPQASVTPLNTVSVSRVAQSKPKEEPGRTDVAHADRKAEEEVELLFAQMVKEECAFLESELRVILHQGKTLKLNLGTDDDKTRIVEITKSIQDFFKELVDICTTQNSEIHILKQNLLQSWAWYEEVKSRYAASKDESMMILLRAQPLDSASEKQLEDIRHLNYYLESQIAQAHRALDEQWENFQDYCKKTSKMQMPTMEMIFQTMVKQNAILRKQNYVLKDIGSRIKGKSRSAVGSSLLLSFDDTKDLTDELKRLRMTPADICQLQYDHVVNRMKNFTKKKTDTLRSFLKRREYPHVSEVKPPLSASVIQASPSTKIKATSLLAPKTPTAIKGNVPKKLEFAQSTPIASFAKPEDPLVDNQTTPIEGLQNFTLKFEAKNFSKIPTEQQSFTPLNKNMIASSPNSAFVATSFGTAVSTSISTSSSFKPVIFGTSTTAATVTKSQSSFMVVTTASAAKPQSTFLSVGTTSSDNSMGLGSATNFSKPFSFSSGSAQTVFQQDVTNKSSTPSFVSSSTAVVTTSAAKPAFSFTMQPNSASKSVPTTTASIFGKAEIKNVTPKPPTSTFEVTSKQISTTTSTFVVTTSTKSTPTTAATPANLSNKNATVFGSVATPTTATSLPFSINSSIFGVTSDKSESVAATKPFIFSSVAATKSTTAPIVASAAQNRTVVSTANPSTAQSVLFVPPQSTISDTSKTTVQSVTSSETPSIVITPKTQAATPSTVSNSSIFGSNQFSAKPGLFTVTSSVQGSLFNSPSVSSTQSSIFAATTAKPVFGGTPVPTVAATVSAVSSPNTTSSVTPTVAVASTSTATPSVSTSSVATPSSLNVAFSSTPNSQSSIFGSVTTASAPSSSSFTPVSSVFTGFSFGSTSTTKPIIFGSTDASNTKPSIFGTPPASTSVSVFGTPSTTATQPVSPVFGTPASSTVSQPSVFGTPASSTVSQPSVFGTPTSSTVSQPSVFGTPTSSTVAQSSVFGNVATSTTTQSQGFSVFGDSSQKGSIFGSTASPNTTQPSLFGSNQNQNTIFGTPTTTTSNSTFKFNTTPRTTQSVFGQTSGFGSSGSSFGSTSPSVFGSAATAFTQSGGSIFGSAATTTSGSIFGSTPTTSSVFGSSTSVFRAPTTSTTSVFGAPATSTTPVFGAPTTSTTSIFGAPTTSTTSVFGSGNLFSSTTQSTPFVANTSSTSFGFGSLNVGSTSSTSSSVFGATQTANPFGGGGNKNIFGSSSGSTPVTSSVFGSSSGSVFGSPSQSFGGNTFGGGQSFFGQQQSGFGQSAFGNSSFGQQNTSGPFSAGGSGSVAQSGFGGSPTFQKPGGFGSSPVFGSSPSFGSAPSFGGAPAFGSAPTFGSPSKIFGSGSSTFGATANTQNTAFGNLANQPTLGFGNLAQQAANAPTPATPFTGSSSFSSWR